jgi:hypothetical protein
MALVRVTTFRSDATGDGDGWTRWEGGRGQMHGTKWVRMSRQRVCVACTDLRKHVEDDRLPVVLVSGKHRLLQQLHAGDELSLRNHGPYKVAPGGRG